MCIVAVILPVDDEPAITDNLAPLLRRAGFEVVVAHDGEAALTQLRAGAPDIVVLDVLLPGIDGRAVLGRAREEHLPVPFVLRAQVGESGERAMALEEGPTTTSTSRSTRTSSWRASEPCCDTGGRPPGRR